MTSTLITSNTFNTTLAPGATIAGEYVDMSINTSVQLWAYSDKNLQIEIVYADSSSGDSSVSNLYSTYADQTVAIRSTKKKTWQKTVITNPLGAGSAERVVVKTKHSIRDPNPVLTYQTDDITLQANINMEDFSFGSLSLDVSNSSIQAWGSTSTTSNGDYRVLLTDTCGRLLIASQSGSAVNISSSAASTEVLIHGTNTGSDQVAGRVDASGRFYVVSTADNPVYITTSAADSTMAIYGNDGTSNQIALTDSNGRFQVTTSAEQSTVKLYATSNGADSIALLVDASGRLPVVSTTANPVYITASAADSTIAIYGNDGTNNQVALTDSDGRFQVTTSAEHSTVQLYATSTGTDKIALLVDASGRIPIVSTATNPVYITASAAESTIAIYGNDGTSNRVALTDSNGRIQITSSAEQSTVQLYATSNGTDKIPLKVDASGILQVAIGDTVVNVDICVQDIIIVHGRNNEGEPQVMTVTASGQLLTTTSRNTSSVQSVYASATNVNADTVTSTMDIGTISNNINIMGQSTQLCTLQIQTSPNSSTFYDSIYSIIIKTTDTNFNMSIPTTERYIRLVPDTDTSLTLSYTY